MPNQVAQSIEPFLNSLKFEKRYSLHTIRAYQDDLIQFFEYLQFQFGEIEITAISSSFVRSWLASLKEAKLSAKSIGRKLSTLKSFFKYQMRMGVLETTPVVNVVAPRISKRLPSYVEQNEMTTLLNDVEFPDDWNGRTDKLLVGIFYNTGMRLSELVNLKEKHINSLGKTVKVLGKGNKERIIPVSAGLINMIQTYQSDKLKELTNADAVFLMVNKKGRKLYPRYVYRVVNKYLKEVTTIDKKSPHILRHTFATHLMNNGADLNSVKELLGHSSLTSTQIYTHNTIEKLKDIHKKAHPKS
ncbi:MAG: tyrosine-type recombinase/integrase [Chitinophagaceae bacterium]